MKKFKEYFKPVQEQEELKEEVLEESVYWQVTIPGIVTPVFIEGPSASGIKNALRTQLKPEAWKELSIERITKPQIKKIYRDMAKDPAMQDDTSEALEESTAAYAKSLEKIARDRQLKMLSKSERQNLLKIAALLDKEKKEENIQEIVPAIAAGAAGMAGRALAKHLMKKAVTPAMATIGGMAAAGVASAATKHVLNKRAEKKKEKQSENKEPRIRMNAIDEKMFAKLKPDKFAKPISQGGKPDQTHAFGKYKSMNKAGDQIMKLAKKYKSFDLTNIASELRKGRIPRINKLKPNDFKEVGAIYDKLGLR